MQGKSGSNPGLLDAGALCRQLVPAGSVYTFLADHRAELFPDEDFADLFPSGTGRPSVPAAPRGWNDTFICGTLEGHAAFDHSDAYCPFFHAPQRWSERRTFRHLSLPLSRPSSRIRVMSSPPRPTPQ